MCEVVLIFLGMYQAVASKMGDFLAAQTHHLLRNSKFFHWLWTRRHPDLAEGQQTELRLKASFGYPQPYSWHPQRWGCLLPCGVESKWLLVYVLVDCRSQTAGTSLCAQVSCRFLFLCCHIMNLMFVSTAFLWSVNAFLVFVLIKHIRY